MALLLANIALCTEVTWIVSLAIFVFWIGGFVIIFRRPTSPTRADLAVISLGYGVLVAIGFAVWHINCLLGRY